MKTKLLKHIIGYMLYPLLFARTGLLLTIPLLFNFHAGAWLVVSILYVMVFMLIIGSTGLLELILDGLIKLLRIKYEYKGQWTSGMLHSATAWDHPTYSVNGRDYDFVIATMGGNKYDPETSIKRKIITAYLFTKRVKP